MEDRHSEFISAVVPVSTEEEAIAFIESRKKLHPTAKHTVYAYIVREGNTVRYSDDGEPHSTAGMPTLEVLRKRGITDVCAVTTRYFGGILLGTGGLVHAYTEAVNQALTKAEPVTMCECAYFGTSVEYNDYDRLVSLLKAEGVSAYDTEYAEKITLHFSVPTALCNIISEKITDAFCGKLSLSVEKTAYGIKI